MHVSEQPPPVDPPPPRSPQSWQSVPTVQMLNSAPGPLSSQSPSDAYVHVSEQPPPVDGDGAEPGERGPQSVQSVP